MSKQEEIRKGLFEVLFPYADSHDAGQDSTVDSAMRYLHSQDVGFRGLPLGASHPHMSGYFTFEPLIKEE